MFQKVVGSGPLGPPPVGSLDPAQPRAAHEEAGHEDGEGRNHAKERGSVRKGSSDVSHCITLCCCFFGGSCGLLPIPAKSAGQQLKRKAVLGPLETLALTVRCSFTQRNIRRVDRRLSRIDQRLYALARYREVALPSPLHPTQSLR